MSTTLASPPAYLRDLVVVNRALGALCILIGGLCLAMWWSGRTADRHGMMFVFLAAIWIGPAGPLFFVAATALRRGWRARWVLQALPVLYPVVLPAIVAAVVR
jgi:hypothetical protein